MIDYNKAIETLENAISSGSLEVTIGEQTVKYRSISELQNAINYFRTKKHESERSASSYGMLGGSVQALPGRGIRP